jgi:hypothetical protein
MPALSRQVHDLRRGTFLGLLTGVVFAAWATIAYALAGDGPFLATHTTLTRVVTTYLTVGLVAGALVGGLWRAARTTPACYVVAIPAAAACAAGIILMHAKYWRAWDVETWGLYGVLVVVGTLVIGNQINVRRVAKLAE